LNIQLYGLHLILVRFTRWSHCIWFSRLSFCLWVL